MGTRLLGDGNIVGGHGKNITNQTQDTRLLIDLSRQVSSIISIHELTLHLHQS